MIHTFYIDNQEYQAHIVDGQLTDIFKVKGECQLAMIMTDELVDAFKDSYMAVKK